MPIKPPHLDDRRYADIVREARALIPQYCPDWTNLSDADPGMTLVQLFAWMTEMTIFRLNRVPDKTYVHFLNFIGEERRQARPASVPLTFRLRDTNARGVDLAAFTRCSTRQSGGTSPLHFLTADALTVHDARIERIVAVHAGRRPMVREIPYAVDPACDQVLVFGKGNGVQLFRMDPDEHGPHAYTPHQYLYLSHDDFRLMDFEVSPGHPPGRVRLRTATEENLPVGGLFDWEMFDGTEWVRIGVEEEEQEVLGLPEVSLVGHLPGQAPIRRFGHPDDTFTIPELPDEACWIRGTIAYERWLAQRMSEDLEITWRDDRGGEERLITNWDVRDAGRNLEFFVQDMPPIRSGWTVRLTMVDRSMPAGRNAYFPRYRWSYRRNDTWEIIPADRVRIQGTSFILTGPFTDMATDGYNLRAERVEAVSLRSLIPDLEVEGTWVRPVVVHLAAGPEESAAVPLGTHQLPQLPFQPAPTLPPLLGMKFFVGSDLLANRAQKPVFLDLEVGFELDGEPVAEPKDAYRLQLTYRAADSWRVVHSEDGRYAGFTFADLEPGEGPGRRRIRLRFDPREQLDGLVHTNVGAQQTCWLRFELTRAAMTVQEDKKSPPVPISLRIFDVKTGIEGELDQTHYEQPLPGLKTAMVEYRHQNRRLSRAVARTAGRLSEHHPFDTFIDVEDSEPDAVHSALYVKLDRPLPPGERHAFMFRCRGETWLPEGVTVHWEQLEDAGHGRVRWKRLVDEDAEGNYRLDRTGVLEFRYPDPVPAPREGVWLRAFVRPPTGEALPSMPPVTHLLLNSVDGVNLHEFRMEKFSGEGIPHQVVALRRSPIFLHDPEEAPIDPGSGERVSAFAHPDRFHDMRVYVVEEDGERREWRRAPGNSLLTCGKDDRVFVVDPVEGTLTFGNGIRGRMLPVGSYNVTVEVYHVVPGEAGNVGPREVALAEGFADLVEVTNVLPATGGRNAETIEEIIRRAPSVLTSRDRAVTRLDFEIIAKEASAEVARAACDGRMSRDGEVEVVILPKRRPDEVVPDPFLSTGLEEHVQRYLSRRCLVNVQPRVRLATFQEVDVSVVLRLRPHANFIHVREQAKAWVKRFLDPYEGGLDGAGWPFGGSLYAQDFGRMVADLYEVRHVADVQVYPVRRDPRPGAPPPSPGWEKGQGVQSLVLEGHDLFVLRHVRVISEEGAS